MNPIDDKWRVKVKSGPKWFQAFGWLRDEKDIQDGHGYNVIAGFEFGCFWVEDYDEELFILRYENYPIIDIVWFVDGNKLSGEFYREKKYVGTFDMIRIKRKEKK